MRRRVIVFANGWGTECLKEIGFGIRKVANANDMDVFVFVNYAAHGDIESNQIGDFNVFTIPDINDFDCAVVLASSFNTDLEKEYVTREVLKAGIPAVSVEEKIEGMSYFGVDDTKGMSELTEHLITEHNVKDILFIGGIEGHEGSKVRLEAVINTAKEHGISIPKENILYGNFAAFDAIASLKEWRKSHSLPEAIICANDIMAIGICDHLKEEGIAVPDEIKVTGFDCLKVAGEHEPSITSVNRDWTSMGESIMNTLIDALEGREFKKESVIDTNMVAGESCGCVIDEVGANTWKHLRDNKKIKEINGFLVDQHFRHMFLYLRKVVTIDDMCRNLSSYYLNENWLEGNNVMLALSPDFFVYNDNTDENAKMEIGYPEEMDVACLICNGKSLEHRRAKTANLIFEAAKRNNNPDIYIFAPVRNDNEMYGFTMMSGSLQIVQNDILYIWTRHMNQYLEQIKSNVAIDHLTKRLEALSVTDKLTGVYNRTGCETIIYSALERNQIAGGKSVIMLADLDRLKRINDMYGHSSGDEAIKISIALLKEKLPEEYMIGRFGGDEFLIAAPLTEELDVDAFVEDLMQSIRKAPVTKEYPFDISVSIGGTQLSPGKEFRIQECLPILDQKMYKLKEIHHEKLG